MNQNYTNSETEIKFQVEQLNLKYKLFVLKTIRSLKHCQMPKQHKEKNRKIKM